MNGEPLPPFDADLSDGVVRLRSWENSDVRALEFAAQDPYIPLTTTVPINYNIDAGFSWIERQHHRIVEGRGYSLCIADIQDDKCLGMIGLWLDTLPEKRARCGYWIIPSARRHGIARRALEVVCHWGFTAWSLARIELLIEPENIASKRTAEAASFTCEGCLRSYMQLGNTRRDMLMYSRLHDEA
jgi:[ribosomal protein S5]-alanine N-acetyltransferase